MADPIYLFEVEVIVRGPGETVTTNYGERTDRPTYARLEIPVTYTAAWSIYQYAVEQAIAPNVGITLPEIDPASGYPRHQPADKDTAVT